MSKFESYFAGRRNRTVGVGGGAPRQGRKPRLAELWLAPLGLLGPLDIKSSHTCTRFVSPSAVLTKEAAFFAPVRVILAYDSW